MAPRAVTDGRLSPRYEQFVSEYLTDFNASRAARACGSGAKRADQAGYELLRKPEIQQAIAVRVKAQLTTRELSAARVLEELRRIAFFDPADCFDEAGALKEIHAMAEETRAAIAGLEVAQANTNRTDGKKDDEWLHKIKLANKLQALELLGKYFKLFADILKVEGDWDKLAARLASARKLG